MSINVFIKVQTYASDPKMVEISPKLNHRCIYICYAKFVCEIGQILLQILWIKQANCAFHKFDITIFFKLIHIYWSMAVWRGDWEPPLGNIKGPLKLNYTAISGNQFFKNVWAQIFDVSCGYCSWLFFICNNCKQMY